MTKSATIVWEQIREPQDLNIGDKVWIIHLRFGQLTNDPVEVMDKWKSRFWKDGSELDMDEKSFPTYFRIDFYHEHTMVKAGEFSGGVVQNQPYILIHKWNNFLPKKRKHNGFEPFIVLRQVETEE